MATAYARPADAQLLQLLLAWGFLETELPGGALPRMMKRGLGKIGLWLKRNNCPLSEELLTALNAEFVRLFRGLSRPQSPPPPYESVYTDEGVLYGPSTGQVAQKYRRFNLKGQSNEPPDHIALELDFMRFLCQREALAWQKRRHQTEQLEDGQDLLKEEDAFLNEHLVRWVPALCQNIRRFDATGFYNGLADMTEGWIYCDRRLIKGLTDVPIVSFVGLPTLAKPGS